MTTPFRIRISADRRALLAGCLIAVGALAGPVAGQTDERTDEPTGEPDSPTRAEAAESAPSAQELFDGLEPRYRQWVASVAGLITRAELDYFSQLEHDYQRDAFMEAFWQPRDPDPATPRNALRERWQQAIDQFGGAPTGDPRFLLYLLNGPPGAYSLPDGRPVSICYSRDYDLEIWFYGASERTGRRFPVILFKRSAADQWRVYLPGDPLRPARRFGGLPTTDVGAFCDDWAVRWTASEIGRLGGYTQLIREVTTPPMPSAEWLANLRLSGTQLPEGAATLAVEAAVDFPARRQSRTALRVLLRVPLSEAPGRSFEDRLFHHFELTGEVIRDGRLFEEFRYRFEGETPAGAEEIPLGFTRFLRPGPLTLRLLLRDVFGDRWAEIARETVVPSPEGLPVDPGESLEATLAGDRRPAAAPGQPGLRLDPPPGGPLTGPVRFTARAQGDLDRVTFYLDGRPVLTRLRPPWSAELDLGEAPAPHTVRVVGLRNGQEAATDQIWVNQGAARFRVRLVEPRGGGIYPGSLTARVEVETPGGERPERVEIWRDQERVASLGEPPLSARVDLEGTGPAVIRAIAYLPDGSSAEDAVLVNATGLTEAVAVRLVELPVLVVDGSGEPVAGLTAADFRLFDEGEPRPIQRLLPPAELALQAALLIDRSASIEPRLERVGTAAAGFARAASAAPGSRVAVFSFADRMTVDAGFGSEPAELERALAGLVARGRTALYDSVAQAAASFGEEPGQRALVLFTDGADETSTLDLAGAITAARRHRVTVFAVAMAGSFADRSARRELERLATETGGRLWLLEGASGLEEAYRSIAALLAGRYLLTFAAPPDAGPELRRLRVEVDRRGARVEAQGAYSP